MVHPEEGNNAERSGVVLIRDIQNCLPLTKVLGEGDLLYLLTPAVRPPGPPVLDVAPTDPFEPLGRALAAIHPGIRHIPYMVRDGITQYHVNHLALAKAVIFVITGPPLYGQPSQVALSQVVRSLTPNRPQIVLVCCSVRELGPSDAYFPTLIESEDFSVHNLQSAAGIILDPRTSRASTTPPAPTEPSESPEPSEPSPVRDLSPMDSSRVRWLVQEWDILRDAPAIHLLWCQCLPERFHIESSHLLPILNRIGYSKHFIVRDPASGALVGFCATYTTYIDNRDNSLVGCIATIIVQPAFRNRGIGSSLHQHALRQLATHRVSRLQLGTAFPRLLYGPLIEAGTDEWFRRRGWRIDNSGEPGCGQEVCDWVLDFNDWRVDGLHSSGLTFRQCETHELDQVLEFVVRESSRRDNVGWYDQYCQLAAPSDIHDILLVLEGNLVLAAAITYVPQRLTRVGENLPWARTISDDVGGVACICVTGMFALFSLSLLYTATSFYATRSTNICPHQMNYLLLERGTR